MSREERNYINNRIDQIKKAPITAAHKEKKLNEIEKALCLLAKGIITEEEAIFLCA